MTSNPRLNEVVMLLLSSSIYIIINTIMRVFLERGITKVRVFMRDSILKHVRRFFFLHDLCVIHQWSLTVCLILPTRFLFFLYYYYYYCFLAFHGMPPLTHSLSFAISEF